MSHTIIWSAQDIDRALNRMAQDIVADGTEGVALVGIKSRGVPMAERLAAKIASIQGKPIEMGSVDINLYRDDLSEVHHEPVIKKSKLPFPVAGKGIVLLDDVLYTGRTIRAAMDAVIDNGRPRFIKLGVLVDRGWRELPIQADFVGTTVKTTRNNVVHVRFTETDGTDEVELKG